MKLSFLFKYFLHVEIFPANMGLDRCRNIITLGFSSIDKEALALRHNIVNAGFSAS